MCGLSGAAPSTVRYDASGNTTEVRAAVSGLPVIIAQPKSQGAQSVGGVGISVVVESSSPVTFQWKRADGTSMPGATGDSLYLPALPPSAEGKYYVVVTNTAGSVTSQMAELFIDSNINEMPDTWELAYFGDLRQSGTADFDGDGVSNAEEHRAGTDPTIRAVLRWIAASGDFNTAANWDAGRVPGKYDQAEIGSGAFTLPASGVIVAGRVIVSVPYTASTASETRLRISGKWSFSGGFNLASGRTFTVDGTEGREVTVMGAAALNASSLTVLGNTKLIFQGVTSYTHPPNVDVTWRAAEAGSQLVFPALKTVTGPATAGEYLQIQAGTGACVLLPALTS
ncbi:MAG: hypothetical protein JWM59_2473, partial [Verrucomicrobiales bacterium]|nr:hypothetical protein [Verrucomicrobiales bacterium]